MRWLHTYTKKVQAIPRREFEFEFVADEPRRSLLAIGYIV